jgi:hypothetical protein
MVKAKTAPVALMCLVTFVCYFRPGEAMGIMAEDVIPSHGAYGSTAINLFPSEGGDRSKVGLSDVSLLLDAPYAKYLGHLLGSVASARRGSRLFGFTYQTAKIAFMRAQDALGLKEKFVLYQLRHGGPSHDRAFRIRSLLEIKNRGQWKSDSSLARYEGHARLQQVERRVPENLQRTLIGAPERLEKLLLGSLRLLVVDLDSHGAACPRGIEGRDVSSSSAAAPPSRKRLREKVSIARPGTFETPLVTTSAASTSSSMFETFCERAWHRSCTSTSRVKPGLVPAASVAWDPGL